ncbi:hypothetical protein TSAR_016463 [Trichomalopsis sarcophagae]|uniref:PHD-type domain-containing protein n=1 Tax=Trichomalopsis sarcophagae TaxID=543379 RepID=A0A232EVN7_9HYME|nr:hypothetical protein TSAR_016463 [Trichomalopsis sarcophagae]
MDNAWRDLRFAHLAKDPKFRRIPRSERKVKIDKRFISMFKDKKFAVKYTVDKRGRPINQSSSENLRKYYDLSSDDSDSAEGYLDFLAQAKETEKQKPKKLAEGTRDKKETVVGQNKIDEQGEEESDGENFSSNGSLLLVKPLSSAGNSSNEQEIAEDSADDTDDDSEREENEQQLKSRRKNEKQLDNEVKKKLRDLTVDYARGEGVLISDSSSDEESSEYDDDDDDEKEIEHNWGELDKEAPTTDEITHRLAACNMDWDRIRATDLMVLFNSFLPTGGLIHSVTIYPSDFGLQRMKEEEVKGPIELVEPKQEVSDADEEKQHTDDENGEGSSYHMEKLRQYQLNRLKYYYAVIDFDSASTANKVYTECDGLEYESSSTKLDLRFIPNDMTFENEPKEVCDKLPDLSKYQPRQFTTTALQQVKVDLTWDETNPERQEISQKLNSGKLDEIDKTDIQAYLASGTSEDESEDEVKKQLKGIGNAGEDEDPIDKYKSLLKSIEEAEEDKKNKEVQLEFTWGLGAKEKTEKMVKEKMKQTENLTPFEQYLEKRKLKKIAKREQKKKVAEENDKDESDSEDSIPDGIDMNDPYFAEELKNTKPKAKKRKNTPINDKLDSTDEEEEKKRQAELELLLMDEDDESNKKHFSMKRIEEAESLTKSKKKRLSKKKKDLKEEADKDNFQVDVKDSRFEALFTSHHYNIDPADPHYRKTKGTEALVSEKLKRRSENDKDVKKEEKSTAKDKNATSPKVNAELNTLIKSIKRNTQNMTSRFTIKESNPGSKNNTMDINDIISMPSEAGTESTLESEIDALSKIITDTKDGTQKLEDNDDDFKLDNDDLSFTASFPCDSGIENDKGDLLPDHGLMMKDILDSSTKVDKFISTSVTEGHNQELLDDASKSSDGDNENEKSDNASKSQKENIEHPTSTKSIDEDCAIAALGVNNSFSLINLEYVSPESQVCSDSQSISTLEAQQIISPENKTETGYTENVLETMKNYELVSVVNKSESISNLPTETRELGATFDNKLDTESENFKITETILKENKDEQNSMDSSDDQQDFVNKVKEIQSVVDTCLPQKESDVKTSHSDANKLLKESTAEEIPMELVNENEAENSNIEQEKIVDDGDGDSNTKIIKTKNNEMTNPGNEVEKIVSRVSEVTAKSDVAVPEIINALEMDQTKVNSYGDFKVSQEKEVFEVSLTSSSAITDVSNKGKLKVDSICFEDSKNSDKKQDIANLEGANVTADAHDKETVQEAINVDVHKQELRDTVVENINILEKTAVIVTNETSQNENADVAIGDLKIIESIIDNVGSENNSKISGDDQVVITSAVSSDDKNEIEDTNVKVPADEKLFSRETDDKVDKECIIMQETENIKETGDNLVESLPNSSIILNIAKTTKIDNLVIHANELTTVKVLVQNIASTISHETQEEDRNLTLGLDEHEISKNIDLVESEGNSEESRIENKDKIETAKTEQIFKENADHEIPEETEDPVEINLSLDPDGDSSPISHDVTEEQTVTDPLEKLVEMENIIDSKSLEESGAHQKIDETCNNEQILELQEPTPCAVHEVGQNSGSVLDATLDTEKNSNKETAHFAHSDTSNLPDIDFQSLDEKSQDSLSILNALQSESISIDQEKENNKFESTGKEDEISLIFDESSQSPRHTDKFVNDVYKTCVPDDTINSNHTPVDNIEEFNESSSMHEQQDDISGEIKEDTNVALSLDNGAQSEDMKAPENHLKAFLNIEDANIEDSAEISELESAVKFLQESEEQDIQNSRIVQDNNVNERNTSIFVAVDDSICDNASEHVSDLPETTLDPIAISEAEIISEAAKLESERKEKLQLDHQFESAEQTSIDLGSTDITESGSVPSADNLLATMKPTKSFDILSEVPGMDTLKVPLLRQRKLTPGVLPEASLLDERYKEPPKIEIPEISPPLPSTPRASLLIQKDAKQRLESPDRLSVYSEPKITDTPKKDSEKQQQQYPESENIGSPRIILKIAKSAIAECSEPRSPKSPKIRSAANSPNPDDSPGQKLGKIKLKLSKGGHPSIIPNNDEETAQWHTDSPSSASPLGMKIKLSKSGDASVVESSKGHDEMQKHEEGYRPEMPIGMKIKLSKSGDASIVQHDSSPKESIEGKLRHKDAKECAQEAPSTKKQDSPSIGMKIKLSKSGDASIIQQDVEEMQDSGRRTDSPIGMKIKLSKSGDASVVSNEHLEDVPDRTEEPFKRTDSPMGVRIKLAKSKSGNASIISSETIEESENAKKIREIEALGEESAKVGIGMKIKLSKSGDASVIRDDSSIEPVRKSGELPIGMKIKLSKTGEPSIIHTDISKKIHSDGSIESAKNQSTHADTAMMDLHNKRKEITISPVESKKTKMDANSKQILPDITIQPIASPVKKDQQKLMLDPNASNISRQQMNVINQEISITQICSLSTGDTLMGDRLKHTLKAGSDPSSSSPLNSDCEIIEPQPELIIVNENSNSSQDIMIIDEVPSIKSLVKVPKKRGRPRRNAAAASAVNINMSGFQEQFELQRDPLSLDQSPMPMFQQQIHDRMNLHQLQQQLPGAGESSERPRRTCRSQKSYAPPKRGRGRGRGKRKNDTIDIPMKKQRIEQDLTAIENATTAVISLEKLPIETSPELFKALNQPTLERIIGVSKSTERNKKVEFVEIPDNALTISEMPPHQKKVQVEIHRDLPKNVPEKLKISEVPVSASHLSNNASLPSISDKEVTEVEGTDQLIEKSDAIIIKITQEEEEKQQNEIVVLSEHSEMIPNRNDLSGQQHQNWLAPSIRKVSIESTAARTESTMSTLTVIDEETRMSAESCSRSQTPARNISVPGASETGLLNEESQGSTATTESEKVKVKIRRMEINLDPDEGPFTVEKIAEYEWPPKDDEARSAATRAETFMIQEQISQYLGVKSFKRKYPDLKRRMVDMEERNFLRENGLVSESMCDMGLTAVSSSEVLDIMCSDFPEQYEEYRKHMREKAAKEHSKKQKELSAAANAERNRIDLAEMAIQSALNWNLGLNKARRENRRCSLDLQTFTVHMPKRAIKFDPSKRGSHYPVALIPGQYTDYYREYTPAELSSSSSEGTQDTEGSQSTMDEVDMELAIQSDIKCKMCLNHLNKSNRPEVLIQCGTCNGNVHPSCIDLTLDMVPHIRAYAWQCTDCKTCAQCHDPADEDKMLFCDMCDRG